MSANPSAAWAISGSLKASASPTPSLPPSTGRPPLYTSAPHAAIPDPSHTMRRSGTRWSASPSSPTTTPDPALHSPPPSEAVSHRFRAAVPLFHPTPPQGLPNRAGLFVPEENHHEHKECPPLRGLDDGPPGP